MKTVKIDLPKTLDAIELHIFADEHIGDAHSDIDDLKRRIAYVQEHPNCYAILNGDIMDNATKTSIGDIYSQTMPPQDQIDLATELFTPIKNKILCATLGNHEARTYKKEGIDPMSIVANNLGVLKRYSTTGVYMFLRFGNGPKNRKMCYTLYITHGSGGGRKEGAKAIRLADLACICDADIYVHAHTHLPMTMKNKTYRVSPSNSSIAEVTKLFVNSAANLNYGGYGETLGCKPAATDRPVIKLDGHVKFARAEL